MTTETNALTDTQTEAPIVAPVTVALTDAPVVEAEAVESVQVGNSYEYEKTGDSGLDYALNFVGKLGFGHDSPAVAAAMTGDFGLLRAELSALGPKATGYGDVVSLAEQAFKRSTEKAAANEKQLSDSAVQVAGSAERWGEVQRWASANADAQEKVAINASLAAGGVQAKMAMEYLVRCFDKSTGATREPKAVVQDGAASRPGAVEGVLSASDYSKAVQELSRSLKGRDVEGHPEYRALQQRRLAGQRAGA